MDTLCITLENVKPTQPVVVLRFTYLTLPDLRHHLAQLHPGVVQLLEAAVQLLQRRGRYV